MATILDRIALSNVASGGGVTRTLSVALSSGTSRKLVVCVARDNETGSATIDSQTFNGVATTSFSSTTSAGSPATRRRWFYYDIPDVLGAGNYNLVTTLSADQGGLSHAVWVTQNDTAGAPQIGSASNGAGVGTTVAPSVAASNGSVLLTVVVNTNSSVTYTTPPTSSEVTFANGSTTSGAAFRFGKADAAGDATETVTVTWTQNNTTDVKEADVVNTTPVAVGPTIDTQPTAATVRINGDTTTSATFTVAATTSGGSLTYDWELETSVGGGSYANLADGSGATWTGQTSASCVGTFTAKTLSGRRVRCNVTDSNGTTTTDAVVLTVLDGPVLSASTATTNGSGVASVTMTSDDALSANGEILLVTATVRGQVVARTTVRPA